ncbi:MAG: phosphoribosylaminoimidazolesuccinocarboxamide synthase [Deltaproteobacteria bacterium]|nr:phosphoribosylaminoimidazolesuccinocarboxamide synthase [Deltaproteobacteria bacterium]
MNNQETLKTNQAIVDTKFSGLNLIKKGKVRDVYDVGESLLMVATDRISAFDVVMPNPIPGKGKVLNLISLFWFDVMRSVTDNHIISSDVDEFPTSCQPYADILRDRSVLVKKAEPLPVECIVRGYVSGSGWNSYKESQSICGISLPSGLKESDKLPEPIFTPSTKAELGEHDVNIDFDEAKKLIGTSTAEKVRDLSLMIYQKGAALAAERGIIIADTKFEFGIADGKIILIDEILTPDSSRFWPKDSYKPGGAQKSFDKQYLRDYLLSLDWNKKAPGPSLPDEVIVNTRRKYTEALKLLTVKEYEI